ncbi:MAG: metal ABC transporter ATP-binding protein [Steroidobacteraceae bacterium]
MRGPAIVFDHVSLELGGTAILDNVSFRIEAGALHCIVGANGGGKTSLIRSLIGQMPHAGQIRLEGAHQGPVGYVPQVLDFDRNVPMTVRDVMAMLTQRKPAFLGSSKLHRQGVEAALRRTGVLDKESRPFGGLSGGERQRVLFAQALHPSPALLILDEPSANIDELGAKMVEEVVLELNASGVTVVWINHDWDQVRRVAHSVTGINHKVLFHGVPSEVLTWVEPKVMLS